MGATLKAGVGLTAVAMAQERRVETSRPDGLVNDPLAQRFVTAASSAIADSAFEWMSAGQTLKDHCPAMGDWVGLRTKYLDTFIEDVVRQTGIRQVVLLAAGLDARAFRLSWPAASTIYEIDMPELMEFKSGVLDASDGRPRCARVVIAADLRGDWGHALLAQGFSADEPSLWLVEGLLMYLDSSDKLMAEIGRLAGAGSRLALDHAYSTALSNEDFAAGRETLARNGSSFGETVDDPAGWLRRYGWSGGPVDLPAFVDTTGRQLPAVLDPTRPDAPIFWLATASKLP